MDSQLHTLSLLFCALSQSIAPQLATHIDPHAHVHVLNLYLALKQQRVCGESGDVRSDTDEC